MSFEFSVEDIKNQINAYNQEKAKSSGGGRFVDCAFLPVGNHEGRFLVDPLGNMYESFTSFGYFNKGVRAIQSLSAEEKKKVPAEWLESDPLNDLYWGKELEDGEKTPNLKDLRQWKYGPKQVFLTYFYLTATDTPSDKWKPNNLYCIIGDRKLEEAYMKMVSKLAQNSINEIQKSLTPSQEGIIMQLEYSRGSTGRCVVGVKFPSEYKKVDMSNQVYEPLSHAYISPEFNYEKYSDLIQTNTAALEEAIESYRKWEESQKSNTEGGTTTTETPKETGVQSTPPTTQTTTEQAQPQSEVEPPFDSDPPKQASVDNDPLAKYRRT